MKEAGNIKVCKSFQSNLLSTWARHFIWKWCNCPWFEKKSSYLFVFTGGTQAVRAAALHPAPKQSQDFMTNFHNYDYLSFKAKTNRKTTSSLSLLLFRLTWSGLLLICNAECSQLDCTAPLCKTEDTFRGIKVTQGLLKAHTALYCSTVFGLCIVPASLQGEQAQANILLGSYHSNTYKRKKKKNNKHTKQHGLTL